VALAVFGLAYAILIAVFFFCVEDGGFFSLPAVQALFRVPEVAWAGWLHYLAFDLFVGTWIAERLDALGVSRLAQAPILAATFMFGPFGYLLYLACAWSLRARAGGIVTALARPDAERTATAALGVCLALFATGAGAWVLDGRTVDGAGAWAKPQKFAASFALHVASVLWLATLLTARARTSRLARGALTTLAVATIVELLYIFLQAARGRRSQFNLETPFETAMYYAVMGGAALAIVGGTLTVGLALRKEARPDLGAGLAAGAWLGAIASSVLTLAVAGALASGNLAGPAPFVGGAPPPEMRMPVTGWSMAGGDLRVPHFFATHLLQLVPAVGWAADRLRFRRPAYWAFGAAALGTLVVGVTFLQALAGQPFPGGA
jgi:hypothetical protein